MIDYIRYTVDNQTYSLNQNPDGSWSAAQDAPSVVGNYGLLLEISENGIISYVDSTDSRYDFFLEVIASVDRLTHLEEYVPEIIANIDEMGALYDTENIEFDRFRNGILRAQSDAYILTASNDAITRREKWLGLKGIGTLEQRKNYLLSLYQKGRKLNEATIKTITHTIAGADCIVEFYGASDPGNPQSGYGLLRVQVLSPENGKDYRYEDIARAITPLVPAHIKLIVLRYFATWGSITENFASWETVRALGSWQALKDYIPPQ